LLLVAVLLVNAPNCHLSLVLASVVQGDAVNCNRSQANQTEFKRLSKKKLQLQRMCIVRVIA